MPLPKPFQVCLAKYLWLWLMCPAAGTILAQMSIPVGNATLPSQIPAGHLEVEQIEIERTTALPTSIHRHSGKFLLLVSDPQRFGLSFVITKVVASDSAASPAALLTLDRHYPVVAHKQAALIDLPVGQYEMKAIATGQVYCSFTIE